MLKKFGVYSVLFGIFVLLNFMISVSMLRQIGRARSAEQILSEIAQAQAKEKKTEFSLAQIAYSEFDAQAYLGDSRVANLKAFFRKFNSPLYDEAGHIVAVSDRYHFDYRLLPAIAMQESNVCKYIPEGSHNCWGWGIYGDTVTKFDSYAEAIEAVSKGIKEDYIDKGLVTATSIMSKYTPSSPGTWAHGVNTFLEMLQ